MKKTILVHLFFITSLVAFGQSKPIDLNEIKSIAGTDTYNRLFTRFLSNDTTLSLDEYKIVYYGEMFRDNYKPGARHDSVRVLNSYIYKNKDSVDFKKVLNYSQQILKDFPFNIEQIYITGVAFDKIGKHDLAKQWFYKYDKLISTILSSGNGRSEKTAFIVTKVVDEYSILNALGFDFSGQSLISKKNKHYDIMKVQQNKYSVNELYFDITFFYGKEYKQGKATRNP